MNIYNTSYESEIIKNVISKTIYYYHVSNNSIKDLFFTWPAHTTFDWIIDERSCLYHQRRWVQI